jgi:hypothetical protein
MDASARIPFLEPILLRVRDADHGIDARDRIEPHPQQPVDDRAVRKLALERPEHLRHLAGGDVRRAAVAVDASLRAVEVAAESEADLLIVHHGISWGGGIRRIDGGIYRVV